MSAEAVDQGHATAGAERDEAVARRLDGSVAVVTGGAGVIGAGIARRFLEAGARVIIGDLDGERATATAKDLGTPDTIVGLAVDVSSQEDAWRFIDEAGQRFGRLDILVNGAG